MLGCIGLYAITEGFWDYIESCKVIQEYTGTASTMENEMEREMEMEWNEG